MGLFTRSKTLSEEEQVRQAQLLILEIRQVSTHSPEKAFRILRKQKKPLYEALTFHGRVHEDFKQLIQSIWSRDPAQVVTEFPTIETIPWSTWERPRVRDLHAKATDMVCEILYCTAPEAIRVHNAVFELEALQCFSKDSNTVMALIGEMDTMFRKSYLVEGLQGIDTDSEEILQTILDHIEKFGKKAVTIW